MEFEQYRKELAAFLDGEGAHLAPAGDAPATLAEHMAQHDRVMQAVYEAGFSRWGWPELVGGFGGTSIYRAELAQQLVSRGLVDARPYSMTEVLVPSMMHYARPELAAEMVPKKLSAEETWCQGFSEPGTGSNLAALSCRATQDGDVWRVSGQKVWTSFAQFAQRCVLLTRTGTPESAHKGITAFFVDMDSPGITARPIETIHGSPEFCEVFFDDVVVPDERRLGEVGQGWALAMDLLPFERSTALWVRAVYIHRRLQDMLDIAPPDSIDPKRLGEVTQLLYAFMNRSRLTQHRMARGETLGAETSLDKVHLATAEHAVFDLIEETLADQVLLGDDTASAEWRADYLYSRSASIYGGSSEIQRNIIARRVLDLGNDR